MEVPHLAHAQPDPHKASSVGADVPAAPGDPQLSLRQAALESKLSIRTLQRHNRDGRLAFERGPKGRPVVRHSALSHAHILRISQALATNGIPYSTFQSYCRRVARRNPDAIWLRQDRARFHVSMAQAKDLAEAILAHAGATTKIRALNMHEIGKARTHGVAQAKTAEQIAWRTLSAQLAAAAALKSQPRREAALKRALEKMVRERDAISLKNYREAFWALYALRLTKVPEERHQLKDTIKKTFPVLLGDLR